MVSPNSSVSNRPDSSHSAPESKEKRKRESEGSEEKVAAATGVIVDALSQPGDSDPRRGKLRKQEVSPATGDLGFSLSAQNQQQDPPPLSSDADIYTFVSSVVDCLNSDRWKYRSLGENDEDALAIQLDQDFKSHFKAMVSPNWIPSDREEMFTHLNRIVRALNCTEKRTPAVVALKEKITRCIFTFAPNQSMEADQVHHRIPGITPEIFAQIMSSLPSSSDEEIVHSLSTIRNFYATNPTWAYRALAEWINRQDVPIDPLRSWEIDEIAHQLTFLNIHDSCLNAERWQLVFQKCTQVEKLVLHFWDDFSYIIGPLPSNLKKLVIDCPGLEELPALPASLIELNCEGCQNLRELPALPASLRVLECWNCDSLTELPELPASLRVLNCGGCYELTELPELPASLIELDCLGCDGLEELPELPAGLTELNCEGCGLEELPEIPAGCK